VRGGLGVPRLRFFEEAAALVLELGDGPGAQLLGLLGCGGAQQAGFFLGLLDQLLRLP
jgi:hypothetical protein